MSDEYEEPIYVCMSCGYEDDPDRFGKFCPKCGTDLDELERQQQDASSPTGDNRER